MLNNYFYYFQLLSKFFNGVGRCAMAAELQPITMKQVLVQWTVAQGERWTASPHCSFCQQLNQDWFNHWRSGEVLNICGSCFHSLSYLQCGICLGVGTTYDMRKLSLHHHLCPNCSRQQPPFGLQ